MNKKKKVLHRKTKIYLTSIAVVTIGIASAILLGAMSYNASQSVFVPNEDLVAETKSLTESDDLDKDSNEIHDKIYDNIFINDIDVGGLTQTEAISKIEQQVVNPAFDRNIILTYNDKEWPMNYKDIGLLYNTYELVSQAYQIGRSGTPDEQKDTIKSLSNNPKKLELNSTVNEDTIKTNISEISKEILIPATNPKASRVDGKWVTTEGKSGLELDLEDTLNKVMDIAKSASEGTVVLLTKELKPAYSVDAFNSMTDLIGSYSTNYNTGAGSRNTNLKVAAERINDTLLFPGEVFSTNRALGPSTYENGYVDAPVIVGGVLEDGIGGGVCQVSSTLYNAVLFSELQIVERQNHSLAVGYVPAGRDATLAGDYIDFKFKNSLSQPIYVESYLSGGKVVVNIYGDEYRASNRKLEFESITTGSIAATEREIQDSSLPAGTRKVKTSAKPGKIVEVYKKVIVDGNVVERTKVNTSRYKATAGEVLVGTGNAVPTDEETNTQDVATPENTQQDTQAPANNQVPTDTQTPSEAPTETLTETPTETLADIPAPADNHESADNPAESNIPEPVAPDIQPPEQHDVQEPVEQQPDEHINDLPAQPSPNEPVIDQAMIDDIIVID